MSGTVQSRNFHCPAMYYCQNRLIAILTNWSRQNMAAILQTTFLNDFLNVNQCDQWYLTIAASMQFSAWESDTPERNNEFCAFINSGSNYKWRDSRCNSLKNYLCQYGEWRVTFDGFMIWTQFLFWPFARTIHRSHVVLLHKRPRNLEFLTFPWY